MGCASSKHLKHQARSDGWASPPQLAITPKCKTPKSDCSVEYYQHHHYVALTSSSYGYLKVDPPNSAENMRKHRKPCSVVLSLNNMYDKLISLDMTESSSSTSILGVFKKPTTVENRNASSSHASSTITDSINAGALELPTETIDVQDMMQGLEEGTARGPPPAKSPIGAQNTHPKGLLTGHHRKFDGHTTPLFALEKLDAAWHQGPAKTSIGSPSCLAGENDGYANENAAYGGSKNDFYNNNHHRQVLHESALLPLMSNNNYNSIENRDCQPSYSITKDITKEKSIGFAKSASTVSKGGPPHKHPHPPGMKYSPDAHGNVKLNLNKDHKNKYFKVSPLSIPTRSLSRRAFAANKSHPESPLFDPDLVASYEKALQTLSEEDWNTYYVNATTRLRASPAFKAASPHLSRKAPLDRKLYNPLECFEEKCPPGGQTAVVLYTTTLRGIRKTFEDCNHVREILQSFGLRIDERDVSMHLEFLNELRQLMGRVMSVPRLFIKGRYIGGEEEVSKLHEGGQLVELVEGMPKERNGGGCDGCGGVRFVPCLECSGSCKLLDEENNKVVRCPDCNENGLIQCPICT